MHVPASNFDWFFGSIACLCTDFVIGPSECCIFERFLTVIKPKPKQLTFSAMRRLFWIPLVQIAIVGCSAGGKGGGGGNYDVFAP